MYILNGSNKKTARIAGLLYLVVVLTGILSLAYIPSQTVVWNDAAASFRKLSQSAQLFRLGIAANLLCSLFFLLLPLVLYRLLSPVNKSWAILMVVFAAASVPISIVNIQHKFAVLTLISGENYLQPFSIGQLQSQVMFYLQQYENGNVVVQLFWGLWLLPFGYLVYRSGILPKLLGILLMLGCLGYLINCFGNILFPAYSSLGISSYVRLPASIGEIGACLWLLLFGAKNYRQHAMT